MPPSDFTFRVSERDLAQLEEAIGLLCEPRTPLRSVFCSDVPYYPGCPRVNLESLLYEDCGQCHGANAPLDSRVALGGATIGDFTSLLAEGYLLPCAVAASPVVQALRSGAEGPHQTYVRFPTEQEIQRVEDYTASLCQ